MKRLLISAALLASFAVSAPVSAQMVVNKNVGEQVDVLPYRFWHGPRHHHTHRHYGTRAVWHRHAWYRPRIVVVQSAFPTPQPLGWFNCCQ